MQTSINYLRSARRGHFGCQTAVNNLDEALPSCLGARAAAGGPSNAEPQWPPPGAQHLFGIVSRPRLVAGGGARQAQAFRISRRQAPPTHGVRAGPPPVSKIFRALHGWKAAGARRAPNDDTDSIHTRGPGPSRLRPRTAAKQNELRRAAFETLRSGGSRRSPGPGARRRGPGTFERSPPRHGRDARPKRRRTSSASATSPSTSTIRLARTTIL